MLSQKHRKSLDLSIVAVKYPTIAGHIVIIVIFKTSRGPLVYAAMQITITQLVT